MNGDFGAVRGICNPIVSFATIFNALKQTEGHLYIQIDPFALYFL